MKKVILWILGIIVVVVIIGVILLVPFFKQFLSLDIVEIDQNLKIFVGYGGNTPVLKSADGSEILIVDTKMAGGAKKLLKYVNSISPDANITIVNTHFHADHTGGNKKFENARIITGAYTKEQWMKESGMEKLPDVQLAAGEEQVITIGDDTVRIRNMGQAHTWNDVIVYFENRKMLITGDLVFNGWHPALFTNNGSKVSSWISALDTLINKYDIETVVPGHGPIADKSILIAQRDYFTSIKDAIGDEEKLTTLKAKYKDYFKLPMTTSFENTVKFIENEK